MPVVDKTIQTRHAEIRLSETSGKGLPILMLHGSGGARQMFAKQLSSPLAEVHRMVAIDLPGHGQSSDAFDPSATYTISGLAAAVADVLDQLGIKRALVYGWSLGGHVAMELTASHPAIAGLMLTGAPPVARGPLGLLRGFHTHWDLLLASKRSYSERDAERFEQLCFGGGADPVFLDMIRRADGRVRTNVFKSMMLGAGADQKRVVESTEVSVAMVNGADDPFVRLGYVAGLSYRTLWDGRCHVIAGAGHAPFWTAAEIFNPLLFRFVRHVMEREFESGRQERKTAGAA